MCGAAQVCVENDMRHENYIILTFSRNHIKDHTLEVLLHGIKHDHPKLINEAARAALFTPVLQIVERLPLTWVIPWVITKSLSGVTLFFLTKKKYTDQVQRNGQRPNFRRG